MRAVALSILMSPEVIVINQDRKKAAFAQSSNTLSEVIFVNCSSSTRDPKRRPWTFNAQEESFRSAFNR
jgi:hypothetical protein